MAGRTFLPPPQSILPVAPAGRGYIIKTDRIGFNCVDQARCACRLYGEKLKMNVILSDYKENVEGELKNSNL